MTNERRQKIERLYQATLQQAESRRAAYLKANSAGDEDLRAEVEALLARHESLTGPLQNPTSEETQPGSEHPMGHLRDAESSSGRQLIGRRIGSFEILSPLGAGGMGEVYRAKDIKLERQVAIKFLPSNVVHDASLLSRFRREAQMLAALNHPNIATVHGLEESEDVPCLVMELVTGQTLAERLANGALPPQEALKIAIQIAEALDAAHRVGITHRDIKPANIIVTPEGRVKVLDFGLAKSSARPRAASDLPPEQNHRDVTQPGVILGTPGYMSPEQVRGEPADQRSDIWAFGCVLFELLSGRRCFPGRSFAEFIASVLRSEPDWPVLPAETPGKARSVLRHCLQKDPGRRWQSITEAIAELKEALHSPAARETPAVEEGIRSLAVLPFVNSSGDSQMDYLSDGLTESIILNLSQFSQLRVVARSTVFRHKGPDIDAQKIGGKLGVGAVVTGAVSQRGDTLVVSAELIDVQNGWQLWGAQYRRKSKDILDTEEDIAREISQKLRLQFSPEKQTHRVKDHTENVEAYHLYLKGRYFWGKRTEEALFKGLQYFREAIDKDPTYARAYAGLAEGYVPLAVYCHLSPHDAVPKAKAAAKQALEIDPELPEALVVMGATKLRYDWDLAGAERDLRAAIALDPNYPRTHQALAECLAVQRRFEETLTEAHRALELDPLSLHLNAALVMEYHFCGRSEEAIELGRKAIELEKSFYPTRFYVGLAYQQCCKFAEAAAELEQAIALSNQSTLMLAALGGVYAAWGKAGEARKVLNDLREIASRKYVPQTFLAAIHAGLGDKDSAFTCLEKACEERCVWLLRGMTVDPRFNALRGEARFLNLAHRLGLA